MAFSHLVDQLLEEPSVAAAIEALKRQSVAVLDLPLSARSAVAAAVIADHAGPTLVVVARADRAEALATAIAEYLPPRTVLTWPAPEALPYEQLPFDLETATERAALLDQLSRRDASSGQLIVITPAHGLMQIVMTAEALATATRMLRAGTHLSQGELMHWALDHGFEVVPLVTEPGQIARRGSILDIFPPGTEEPVRVDFFGDEIDAIRPFHPHTQRSRDRLREVRILPPAELPLDRLKDASQQLATLDLDGLRAEVRAEWSRTIESMASGRTPASIDLFAPYLIARPSTLIDYADEETLIVLDEPAAIDLVASQLERQATELRDAFVANGELPAGLRSPIAEWSRVRQTLSERRTLSLGTALEGNMAADHEIALVEPPRFAGRLGDAVDAVRERLAQGWKVAIATDQVERLTELFEERDVFPRRDLRRDAQTAPLPLLPGVLEIRASDLDSGWSAPESKLLLLADLELFGFRKQTRRAHRRQHAEAAPLAASLSPGDHVVHVDYGVGIFRGLVRLEAGGVEREYLHVDYAKGDRLYVPVDQTDRVVRYSGGGIDPTLTRLGSGEWQQTRRRVRRAVREMAFELIQLYASRETTRAQPYGPDTVWDHELASSFPYVETPDQHAAIEAVTKDLRSSEPMDRLIVGDVGFGKTEVALRSAFRAVNDGRQVAVLVPTTILALQHYTTFAQRLAAFPVRVEMLSRLRSRAEQRKVLAGLADGQVDIVIGTHRLVQHDVQFKNLGLVVIDEEQRFGVRQKEFLKRLRTEVDVLTMSATPIPRTLHMALAGIRDISMIDTAPQARLPIRTFVTPTQDQLIREVILREIDRGGQVYFVHNRVHDIDRVSHRLRHLVPEARFGVGHGQMDEEVLEEIVLGFVRCDFDVLISTTIIESGVDIPNVNTIIIDNADTLGLTQLYQLRGRVGRSTNRAYAYLLYKPDKSLSAEAQERLVAIQEATELGAGLRLAMRDMEIRGAGNILGAEQSGHIAAIGYELYIRLLAQAVDEIRSGEPHHETGPVIMDLPLTALIPFDYIVDTELRLAIYRRIAAIADHGGLADIRLELVDRFGQIPEEVEHLLALIALRIRAQALGIESLIEREREIVIRPVPTAGLERGLTTHLGRAVKLTAHSIRIRLPDLTVPWQEAVDVVLDAVASIDTEKESRREPTTAIAD
ncbi:MAG: transcription-repair coupling factor [Chloroflexia bacterium]|nr:transcription-repair coupling factor [Chloroflexia bacterium]